MKKNKRATKYIFVIGGVMSGVGKGITASSIGKILQCSGYRVTAIKIDPYVNVDAGTMNPIEHGETFVLEDGYETDQDMGNYERFLNCSLGRESYMTTGSVYQTVITKERSLGYDGKTVSVVPHIPAEVVNQIQRAGKKEQADIVVIEIGGTVGEYENILFLEAGRMMKRSCPGDVAFVLVSYLPIPSAIGEMKTKPTQQAIRTMQESGIFPDIVVGRAETRIDIRRKEKIAHASLLHREDIISAPNMASIYDIPEHFIREGLDLRLLKKLGLKQRKSIQAEAAKASWHHFVRSSKSPKKSIKIAVIGKYFSSGDFVLSDAYISVIEALKYGGYHNKVQVELTWISSRDLENKKMKVNVLKEYDGILVPGGFGNTGIDGKDIAIRYARENAIPFFGICLGMQRAVIEFAQHVCGLTNAESDERAFSKSLPVITTLGDQVSNIKNKTMGGSMRLGSYPAMLQKGSLARKIYGVEGVSERHRHRYEVNPEYINLLEKHGMRVSGTSPDGTLAEIIELDKKLHPFFIAVQFHPELQARPLDSHPLFNAFIKASMKKK